MKFISRSDFWSLLFLLQSKFYKIDLLNLFAKTNSQIASMNLNHTFNIIIPYIYSIFKCDICIYIYIYIYSIGQVKMMIIHSKFE